MISEFFTQSFDSFGIPAWLLIVVVAWSFVWKGLALWKSAHKNQLIWFVVILVLNTVGILEILYIFLFSEINLNKKSNKIKRQTKKSVKKTVRKTKRKS